MELPKGTPQREVKAPRQVPQKITAAANEKTAGKKGGFFGDLFKSSESAAQDQTKTNSTPGLCSYLTIGPVSRIQQ